MALDPGFQLDFVVNLEVSVVPPGFVSWSWGVLHVSKAGYRFWHHCHVRGHLCAPRTGEIGLMVRGKD